MTGYQRVPYLLPAVGPMACFVIAREVGDVLEQHAARLESSPSERTRAAGEQLRVALAGMRESARQWRARELDVGSADGTSEPGNPPGGASSSRMVILPPESPTSRWWTAPELAAEGRVSPSYVTRLCRVGTDLRGQLKGRVWFIEDSEARRWLARRADRRPVA